MRVSTDVCLHAYMSVWTIEQHVGVCLFMYIFEFVCAFELMRVCLRASVTVVPARVCVCVCLHLRARARTCQSMCVSCPSVLALIEFGLYKRALGQAVQTWLNVVGLVHTPQPTPTPLHLYFPPHWLAGWLLLIQIPNPLSILSIPFFIQYLLWKGGTYGPDESMYLHALKNLSVFHNKRYHVSQLTAL